MDENKKTKAVILDYEYAKIFDNISFSKWVRRKIEIDLKEGKLNLINNL